MPFIRKKVDINSYNKKSKSPKKVTKNTSKKRSKERYHFTDVDIHLKNLLNDKHTAKEILKKEFKIQETASNSWFKEYTVDRKRIKEEYVDPKRNTIHKLKEQIRTIDNDLQKFYGISLANLEQKKEEEKAKERDLRAVDTKKSDEDLF